MQARTASPTLGTLLSLAGTAAFLLLAATSPARADDKGYKGWFAALDLATTQPNGLDQHFANEPAGAPPDNVRRLVIDNRSHLSWRGSVGYGFGKDWGSLQASYWSFDHEDSDSGTAPYAFWPTIFGSDYTNGVVYMPDATDFKATSKIKARTYDLDYVRPIAVGEKFTVKWLAGLRAARFEEDQHLAATDAVFGLVLESKHLESRAYGPRLGVTGVFGFTRHFSLEAAMAVSFMQANSDHDSSEMPGTNPTPAPTITFKGSNKHNRGEIRDFDFKVVWDYGPVDYFVGYEASEWDGLVTDFLVTALCCAPSPADGARQTIAFNSFHAGITYRFGRVREPPPLQ